MKLTAKIQYRKNGGKIIKMEEKKIGEKIIEKSIIKN